MSDIFVDPTDRCRSFVVVADVVHELAREILYGSEDTSRNNVALNLGKPNFDLVEPTGVGRGVVDANSRVGLKEFKNSLGLVRTQIIGNDVDLATCRLTRHDLGKEIDELCAGMACTGFSQHLSGLSVQSAVERKRSVAVVLKERSSAWMALFSSTQNTAACIGGLRYKPMMSAALSSNSGSSLTM
jgi:hypothetical protein